MYLQRQCNINDIQHTEDFDHYIYFDDLLCTNVMFPLITKHLKEIGNNNPSTLISSHMPDKQIENHCRN